MGEKTLKWFIQSHEQLKLDKLNKITEGPRFYKLEAKTEILRLKPRLPRDFLQSDVSAGNDWI